MTTKYDFKAGDWVTINSAHRIAQYKYDELWPQGAFGKIIAINKRWNPFDGRKLPDQVIVRVRRRFHKGEKITNCHYKTTYERISKVEIK